MFWGYKKGLAAGYFCKACMVLNLDVEQIEIEHGGGDGQ